MDRLNKVIRECEENNWGVTFYGSDKQIVLKALKTYQNLLERKDKLKTMTETYQDDTGYSWSKEQYALETINWILGEKE